MSVSEGAVLPIFNKRWTISARWALPNSLFSLWFWLLWFWLLSLCHRLSSETPAPSLLFLLTVLWLFRSSDNLCELRFLFLVLQMIFLGFWSWLCWICRSLGIQKFKHWINSSDLWNDDFFKFPSHQPVLTFREPNCLFSREWFLWLLLWKHFFNSLNSDHLQHINTHLSNLKLYKVPIFWMLYIDDNHLQT